ncbi:glycosyltransferase family 25 protein [Acinetobacter sp. C32I]|uniref:glycosyltransferase family 25 protein n=1 Tax=Acinetobacter sp. C32I TaxID=2950074 RepID=UPI0020370648|nr:glycosyltransferase family 25 protein [Acinetobacter sp. C32I]USA53215.1 glycosyltransferase family 25 protein [Acinetobacter sp. C32I]
MNVFVISLDSAIERRQHINAEFKKYLVDFSFYNAITPVTSDDAANSVGINLARQGSLTKGEVACLLSHIMLWKKIVDLDLEYMAIFEDDVYLGENIQSFFNDFSWIPNDVHIIKLEAFDKKVDLSFFLKLSKNGRSLYHLKGMHLGGAGYILSKAAAKHYLKLIVDLPELVPVDHILFGCDVKKGKYKAYQMTPAICAQDFYLHDKYHNFGSHLEEDRAVRHQAEKLARLQQKQKMSLSLKIKRELLRLLFQILKLKDLSAYRTVKFK